MKLLFITTLFLFMNNFAHANEGDSAQPPFVYNGQLITPHYDCNNPKSRIFYRSNNPILTQRFYIHAMHQTVTEETNQMGAIFCMIHDAQENYYDIPVPAAIYLLKVAKEQITIAHDNQSYALKKTLYENTRSLINLLLCANVIALLEDRTQGAMLVNEGDHNLALYVLMNLEKIEFIFDNSTKLFVNIHVTQTV